MLGDYVKVYGEISKIKHTKVTSFTIADDSGEIYAFSYDLLNITKGNYEIIGKVDEYYGRLEIEISEMRS